MPEITTRLGLNKPLGNETVSRSAYNENLDILDRKVAKQDELTSHLADYVKHPGYAVTSNSGNAYSVTTTPAPTSYVDGMGIAIKINAASTGASTLNWNGLGAKNIIDSFGNPVTNFRANTIYSLKYEATSGNFIVQGKGGGGNVTTDKILGGYTATADNGFIVGTMPNKTGSGTVYTVSTVDQPIAQGYYPGTTADGKIKGEPNLLSQYIVKDKKIGNVVGTYDKIYGVGDTLLESNINTVTIKGTEIWSLTGQSGTPTDIAVDSSGNIYVTYSGYNIPKTLVKYNSSGVELWSNAIVPKAYTLAVDSSGNVYVGENDNDSYSNKGNANLTKFDSNGNRIWTNYDINDICCIAVDNSGNVFAGSMVRNGYPSKLARVSSSGATGQVITNNNYNPQDIAVDSSGNIYVVNSSTAISKYNSNLGLINTITLTTCLARNIELDSNGNIFVGVSNGGKSLIKLNSSGTELWNKTDGSSTIFPQDIAVDSSGNIYFLNSVNNSKVLVKYDNSGNEIWYSSIMPSRIVIDSNNDVCACNMSDKQVRKIAGKTKYQIIS